MKQGRGSFCSGYSQMGLSNFIFKAKHFAFKITFLFVATCSFSGIYSDRNAVVAQESVVSEYTEDELRQIQLAERFLSILEKNPRRGTAMDRVYGHHIEFGTLEKFVEELKENTSQSPDDGAQWMLLGLFESQRGEDAAAAQAFTKAEALRPEDALAPYYLSQALLRIGENQRAVDAMERAIACKPPRVDLLEIFQQLGRVHQRAQRTEEALDVWKRLEELFPNDSRVLEQIAVTLVDEGQAELALPRYEQLADAERDDYRKTTYRIAAAELKIETQSRDSGLQDFESILSDLNPDGWLFRDVRRRIEDVFLKSGDQDSLVKYYESWISKHPDDVEAMARLARFLSGAARVPEATEWMEKALKLAPSRSDLRKAFIDQLVEQQKYQEAAEQYEALCEAEPNNVDFLRDWGKIVLRDRSVDIEKRRDEALRIWNLILQDRPSDALLTAQVADLCRNAELKEQAFELYKKAITLAPGEPQYREYLGEYYHIEKEPELALETWTGIAAEPYRNAENLARVAEVYNSFGYSDQAVQSIAAAVELEPKEFALQIRAAEYHNRANKYDEALKYIASAEPLATNDEQRETLINQRIDVLQSSSRLKEEIENQRTRIAELAKPKVEDWQLLARYLEAEREWPEAIESIETALAIDEKSVPALSTAARIIEASGDLGKAADIHRRLADADRRSRDDHLMNVARLEAQLGRADEAMEAANQLILAAPGNTDNYEFFAQLCFRLGRRDEGLDALRKAIRINPNEPRLTIALGSALAEDLQTREAIELYWRAFEKTDEVEDKTSLVMKLVPLYEQLSQFDQLVERLERDRREEDKRREMTICLAQAYQTANDFGTARYELESLLSENTRDTNLLQQLAKLCQASGDMESAISYQRQLVSIAPGHETEYPLAGMLQEFGLREEANEILVRLTRREEDPVRLMRSLDSMLARDSSEAVLEIIEPLVSNNREDWELMYREGVALTMLDRNAEAETVFKQILAIDLPHDALGRSAAAKFKQAQQKARSDNLRGINTSMPSKPTLNTILGYSNQVQRATGLLSQDYYSSAPASVWTPEYFALARMASFGWLMKLEQSSDKNTEDQETEKTKEGEVATAEVSIADRVEKLAKEENASKNAIYDYLYVAGLNNDYEDLYEISKKMAKSGSREEKLFFLSQISTRDISSQRAAVSNGQNTPQRSPLNEGDLQFLLDVYQELLETEEDADRSLPIGGQIVYATNGQAYILVGGSYQPLQSGSIGGYHTRIVIDELRLAGRTEQAEQMFEAELAKAESAQELAGVMATLLQDSELDRVAEFYEKWLQQATEELEKGPDSSTAQSSRGRSSTINVTSSALNTTMQWMGKLAPDEEYDRILKLGDSMLDLANKEMQVNAEAIRRNSRRATNQAMARSNYSQVYFGDQQDYQQIQFIVPPTMLSDSAGSLLFQLFYIYKKGELTDQLVDHFRERLSSADDDSRPAERALLASLLWWNSSEDEALEMLTELAQENTDSSFKLALAQLQLQRNQLDLALEIVDSVPVSDQTILRQRELVALGVAERLGDTERARQAAERLFGMRLDAQTQLQLVDPMRRLGLTDLANAVLARAERSSSNEPSAMATLMTMYRGQGKTEDAKKLAYSLLRKTTSPITALGAANQNTRYRQTSTPDSAARTQALRLLQQTGDLNTMVDQLKEQIERYPEVIRSYELLVEYYEVLGKRAEALELMQQIVQLRPKAFTLRMKLADSYRTQRKYSEACDQYLVILRDRPVMIVNDFYQYDQVFRQAKRSGDLSKVLMEIDWRQFRQSYQIVNFVSQLTSSGESSDAIIALVERALEQAPEYRTNLLRNLTRPNMLQNARVMELIVKYIVPEKSQIQANPWAGISEIYSYSGDGTVNTYFDNVISGLKNGEKIATIEAAIQKELDDSPQWLGGKLMLAVVGMKGDEARKADAKENLLSLCSDEKMIETMPYETCWILGQTLLVNFPDQRELGIQLYEKTLKKDSSRGMRQIQYSPVAKLVSAYEQDGRKDEARKMLLEKMATSTFDNYDPQYAASEQVEQTVWCAEQMFKLGFPATTIKLYQNVLADSSNLKLASNWRSSNENYYSDRIKKGMDSALARIDQENAADAIEDLFAIDDRQKKSGNAFELLLTFPEASRLGSDQIQSPMVEVVRKLADSEDAAVAVKNKLTEIQEQRPDDLSVMLLLSMVQLQMDPESADVALNKLVGWIQDHPLEEIKQGRRPNSRQRDEAADQLPCWIVARETIGTPNWESFGNVLADRALEAANHQLDKKQSHALLFEWAINASEKKSGNVEQLWGEVLRIASERPNGRSTENAEGKTSRRLAPLTKSQFDLVINVAERTATLGLVKISQAAVQEALAGGLPVPDPDPSAANLATMGGVTRIVRSSSSTTANNQSPEGEVAAAVNRVLEKWQGDSYDQEQIFETIASFVLPASSPGQIRLYPDSSGLVSGRLSSMGQRLVTLAAKTEKLDWLEQQAKEKQENNLSTVPALVMQTLIAIEKSDDETSKKLLKELSDAMSNAPTRETAELICHAAVPASRNDNLKEVAMPILANAIKDLSRPQPTSSNTWNGLNSGELARDVNKFLASKGTEEQIREQFEERLIQVQQQYANYSGDYGVYQQWLTLNNLANEAATFKANKVVLDFLGRAVDTQVDRYSPPSIAPSLVSIVEMTRKLDPQEAYQAWSAWTLPQEDRRSIRVVAEWISGVNVPDAFADVPLSDRAISESQIVSNLEEFINAASKCGKLDEVQKIASSAQQEKLQGADQLLAFVAIAKSESGDPAEANTTLKTFFETDRDYNAVTPFMKKMLDTVDLQLFCKCLDRNLYIDSSLDKIDAFDSRLRSSSITSLRGIMRHRVSEYLNRKYSAEAPDLSKQPLSNWVAFRDASPRGSNRSAFWTGDSSSATHVHGVGNEYLAFAYPVTGKFEFTIDCYIGDWGECDAGYAGVIAQAQRWGSNLSIRPISGHETLSRKQALKTDLPDYGEFKIVADGEMMQVHLNGYKVYEEKVSNTSPWLLLSTEGTRVSRFMNPRISGEPIVPRSVDLFAGNRMDGWTTSAFSESQPRHRIMAEDPGDENSSIRYYQQNEPTTFSWQVKDGQLIANKSNVDKQDQSWTFYQRPMRTGETFSFDFYYVPGEATVAPTIGQLAMLLEPEGVVSHWISNTELEPLITGVEANNAATEKAYLQTDDLGLKANDWNSVELSTENDKLKLVVNGVAAFERPLVDINDTRFGLFHYKGTEVKVRNAKLSGNWPKDITEATADGWFQWNDPATDLQMAVTESMLPRDLERPMLAEMVRNARELAPEEAYNYLKNWVMPTHPEGRIRLGFAYLSLEQQAEFDPLTAGLDRIVSPGLELVRIAQSAGKLDELISQIDSLKPQSDVDARNQRALKILALMQVDGADVGKELGALYTSLNGGLPQKLLTMERAAELLVAVEAGRHEQYWAAGYDILHRLRSVERGGENASKRDDWKTAVNSGLGAIELRWLGRPFKKPEQWASVPYWKPQWTAQGENNSTWVMDRGAVAHLPADHWSQLFFQSPLRGEYEITARRSTHGSKEVSIATGMHTAEPKWDLKAVRVSTLMHSQQDIEQDVPLPVWDHAADFKILVKDSSVTTIVNGVEIHREDFGSTRDPWLVLQANDPLTNCTVRDLRITGNPTIPDEIDLIDINGWASWRFDAFGDWSSQQEQAEVPYNRVGNEIVGNVRTDRSASPMESLMMYARPMLEDGEIEFETYYEAGKFEVHPAIGQTVFMLDQPEATLHKLTRAQWDRSELAKDNRSDLPAGSEKLELKEKDWNHVRLALAGNEVTLFVNGNQIAKHTIDAPNNERFFGLFRYSDLTKCKIRNLKYRGDWPKTLPSVDQQELAYPTSGPYAMSESEEVKVDAYELAGSISDLEKQGLALLGRKDEVKGDESGLKLELTNGSSWANWPGIARRQKIEGDCEITVSYSGLDIKPVASGWGDSLNLQISMDDPQTTTVEISVGKNGKGETQKRAAIRRKMPDENASSFDIESATGHSTSGRLRIVRDGGRLHCLVADGESNTFQLIQSYTVGTAIIRSVSVQAKSSDDQGAVSATISDLTFKERSSN